LTRLLPLPLAAIKVHQRNLFLVASGLSTAGSFAGLTAKGWLLLHQTGHPLLLALHFAALAMPTLLFSAPAGVLTDREGCEAVLVRAQWGLFGASLIGALTIPLLQGRPVWIGAGLLLSTLLVGVASSYELTARNKYCALLVEEPGQLAPYLASFSVVFNVGKLVGPPLGGLLVAWQGPAGALVIDSASYLLPIASVLWLLQPDRSREQRSGPGRSGSLAEAWREAGATLRHVLRFSALASLVGFFHPGLAALIARRILGASPADLGLFTSVLAAGSIAGGLLLQRNSGWLCRRPSLLLGGSLLLTALAQLGMALARDHVTSLAMSFLIGAGTASLLAGTSLILQVAAPMAMRGRTAALGQIASLGGGGLSGIVAALLCLQVGLERTFGLLGLLGLVLALQELLRNRPLQIRSDAPREAPPQPGRQP
jgi:MFS family permease